MQTSIVAKETTSWPFSHMFQEPIDTSLDRRRRATDEVRRCHCLVPVGRDRPPFRRVKNSIYEVQTRSGTYAGELRQCRSLKPPRSSCPRLLGPRCNILTSLKRPLAQRLWRPLLFHRSTRSDSSQGIDCPHPHFPRPLTSPRDRHSNLTRNGSNCLLFRKYCSNNTNIINLRLRLRLRRPNGARNREADSNNGRQAISSRDIRGIRVQAAVVVDTRKGF